MKLTCIGFLSNGYLPVVLFVLLHFVTCFAFASRFSFYRLCSANWTFVVLVLIAYCHAPHITSPAALLAYYVCMYMCMAYTIHIGDNSDFRWQLQKCWSSCHAHHCTAISTPDHPGHPGHPGHPSYPGHAHIRTLLGASFFIFCSCHWWKNRYLLGLRDCGRVLIIGILVYCIILAGRLVYACVSGLIYCDPLSTWELDTHIADWLLNQDYTFKFSYLLCLFVSLLWN